MMKKNKDLPSLPPGREQITSFHGSWYRGKNTNFIPNKERMRSPNSLYEYFLKGVVPPSPIISKEMVVTAFGSCFAHYVSDFLYKKGYNVRGKRLNLNSHIIRFGEGIVNTFAILQQLEWALLDKELPDNLWFSEKKEIATVSEDVRWQTKKIMQNTEVFIFTLGLSEVWFDRESGEALWRAVPNYLFDKKRHYFKQTTVGENKRNIERIIEVVKKHCPKAKIIFTLSPVPLSATFRPIPCLVANAVSKSTLRCALDEALIENKYEGVYYYPSYEIVTSSLDNPYADDNRHPRDDVVEKIMQAFERYYCIG